MASDKLLSELTKGTWSAETLYTVGDITDHNGSSYISIKNGTNQEPPNAEYWALLASKGDQGERGETGASIVSASFVGDDMVFVKDDEDTIVIPEAKTDLTGAQGLPGDPGQDGDDGREVELQKSATHIQWRYVGEETWNDLVALVDLKGADGEDGTDGTNGREIELQKTDTYIQWRYADDVSWTNLVALADLKGDKGDTGDPGTSFIWKGEWDSETTYEANEAVEHNGSSYIAIAPNTNSEPPSAHWELMAQKGLDGEGAGDVIGPASAVSNNFAAFDGVTGKLLKDSGKKPADFETAGAAATVQGNLESHTGDTDNPHDTSFTKLTDAPASYSGQSGKAVKVKSTEDGLEFGEVSSGEIGVANLLKNGNFINNSTNGYGGTPDDWTNQNANPVQGGFPSFTKQQLIDLLGVSDGDIEGLWNLNGNFNDLSSNGYNLTPGAGGQAPTDSNDGLMAQCKAFATASKQYATTSAANCRIAGSQTLFAFFRLTALNANTLRVLGVADSTPTNFVSLSVVPTTNKIRFSVTGTTPDSLDSDVVVEAGKWYFVVGIYNSSAPKLTLWVNGIKKEVAIASGSHTAGTGGFSVGRMGDYDNANQYFDGEIQNAGVLSVALTDDQVKRLWAATTYKGIKLRRATTNGSIAQSLPQDLVERLRGKTITLRASVYQAVANTSQLSILTLDDGDTSDAVSTTGSWVDLSVTHTVPTNTTYIEIYLQAITSDGNIWYKEVALYEGDTLLAYSHSPDDWSRFPRLLKLTPFVDINGGYHFEENRWYSFTPVLAGIDDGAGNQPTLYEGKFMVSGKNCYFRCGVNSASKVGTNKYMTATLPVFVCQLAALGIIGSAYDANNDAAGVTIRLDANSQNCYVMFPSNITDNANFRPRWGGNYEID